MEEYHQITLSEWAEWKKKLRQELNNVRTAFVRVGYVLRKIDETEAYKVEGYRSVAEFAEKEHGLKPSTTSRWMAINREFSVGCYSEQLDERYIDMNASQLTEMLGLPAEDRELVTSETSRKELRELRRFNKEAEDSEGNGAEESPMYEAFADFLDKNEDAGLRVIECLRSENASCEHIAEAVAPSGSRMFRSGTKFITFQKSDIKVKVFGGNGAESVSWDEFIEIARQWADKREIERSDGKSGASGYDSVPEIHAEIDEGGIGDGNGSGTSREIAKTGRDRAGHDGGDTDETGREGREEDPFDGRNEGERESPAEKDVCEAGIHVDEKADSEKCLQTSEEDPADPSKEEEPAAGDLKKSINAPEAVDKHEREEIAPAQLADPIEETQETKGDMNKPEIIIDESGNPSPEELPPEEKSTQDERIEAARDNVSLRYAELGNMIREQRWFKARELAAELHEELEFLAGADNEPFRRRMEKR